MKIGVVRMITTHKQNKQRKRRARVTHLHNINKVINTNRVKMEMVARAEALVSGGRAVIKEKEGEDE